MRKAPLAAAILAGIAASITFAAQAAQPAAAGKPVLLAAQAAGADAQDSKTKSDNKNEKGNKKPSEEKAKKLQTVSVTGTLLQSPEYQSMVPVQSINVETAAAAGNFTTADMIQTTSIALGSTQINNQFSGFIVEGGTGIQTIDLRGLGPGRTLVLLDGQRPGPAGTRGQTGAGFDLNVVPSVILKTIDIVKDSSSSIYGSDAIAGVVNLITKDKMEGTQIRTSFGVPAHGGAQQTSASIGTGFNFKNGHIVLAAQFQEQFPLANGGRSYLSCPQDRVWGQNGQRIDRKDFSVTGGTPLGGCSNLYANTIINAFNFSQRYVPSRDGSTVGPFAGYHPRPVPTPTYTNNPNGAYYEDQLNFPFALDEWVLNRNRNSSFYASSRFLFSNDIGWTNQFLYNHRQTNTRGFRQFFPIVYSSQYGGYYLPVMPYPSNNEVVVDWYYFRTQLDGWFGDSSWSWKVNATHSHNNGTYATTGIDARKSADLTDPANTATTLPIDYFDPGILNGQKMGQLVNAVGIYSKGRTTYDQSTLNAVFNGDLFSLPAGVVSAAAGVEYRHIKIDDEPSQASKNGWLWGSTSAQTTKGSDHVTEVFGEVGVPVLSDLPGVKSLNLDVSARGFKYQSVGKFDHVWKFGLNWAVSDHWRVRGTLGTAYRAPALYELYLGNQSSFVGQLSIDPCIQWGTSTNTFLRQNCAAAGIPSTYAGGSISATVLQGGGKGFLKPETSRAKTAGIVWSPSDNFGMALDYFDVKIQGEITTLTAGDIVFGCYGRPVYPNAFCNRLTRNGPNVSDPYAITQIRATYVNINNERTRGYDWQANYFKDFSFGRLSASAQVTYTLEDSQQLFSTAQASGFSTTNFVGYIGRPKTTGVADIRLKRGDWTYTWQGTFVGSTRNKDISNKFTYYGVPATRDIKAGWQFRHSVSVRYDQDSWGVLFGIRNVFDKKPDLVSSGVATRKGNVPLVASQYDWFGRTYFLRFNYKI